MENTLDKIGWKTNWQINKFHDPSGLIERELQNGVSLKEVLCRYGEAFICSENFDSNLALEEGLQELIDLICGLGEPTKWDNANAHLGVGDSNIEAQSTQTGLQAQINKTYKPMDADYPRRSNQTVEWRATFGSSDANYAWEEFTVVNASDDSGKNLNRKVASKGTKAAGETWTLSLQITFS